MHRREIVIDYQDIPQKLVDGLKAQRAISREVELDDYIFPGIKDQSKLTYMNKRLLILKAVKKNGELDVFIDTLNQRNEQPADPPAASEDPFRVFRPLMKPLSGVVDMSMLTSGNQKILMIGEKHQTNFCTEKGFAPIARYIEDYLGTAENVDFMLETPNDIADDFEPNMENESYISSLQKAREQVGSDKNTSGRTILGLTRILVTRFLEPNKGAPYQYERDKSITNRVHYLDIAYVRNETEENDPFLTAFRDFVYEMAVIKNVKVVNYIIKRRINPVVVREVERLYNGSSLPWIDASGSANDLLFERSSFEDKKMFVRASIELLKKTKFFKKCFQKDQREVSTDVYVDAFMETNEPTTGMLQFYFYVQRFFMDIYTTCRILKTHTHPTWYKNIVVYGGYLHMLRITNLFRKLGYTEHKVTDIPFNPDCDSLGPAARGGGSRRAVRRKKKARTPLFSRRRRKYKTLRA